MSSNNYNVNYTWPVAGSNNKITSKYGYRDTSGLPSGASAFHQAIDIAASKGTGVLSAASGTIVSTGYNKTRGNYITVQHGNNTVTEYEHLYTIGVKKGQQVTAGQQIGTVGSTGASTGAHLDFRVKVDNKYINPLKWDGNTGATSSGATAVNEVLESAGIGSVNIDTEAIMEAISDNWIFCIGAIFLIAILTK